jgi:predicted enzyme related to lactoylglutathione lyase
MKFTGISIQTNNVPRLVNFYSKVLGLKAEGDDNHSAFGEVNLAIWNPGTIDEKKFKSSERFFTLMYEVANVDDEYNRLKNLGIGIKFLSQPETFPWGARAFSFLDPDGNHIDFLMPAPLK